MRTTCVGCVALVLLAFGPLARAGADTDTGLPYKDADTCTYGDLQAEFESLSPFYGEQMLRGLDTRPAQQFYGPVGGPCQYRIFWGPPLGNDEGAPTQIFEAGQLFLAGIAYETDYSALGITRAQAQNDTELIQDHLYLVPADDQWHFDADHLDAYEHPLMMSAFRQGVWYGEGRMLQQQRAIIDQLPAGHWVSVWKAVYPGNPELFALHPDEEEFLPWKASAVVHLDIEP